MTETSQQQAKGFKCVEPGTAEELLYPDINSAVARLVQEREALHRRVGDVIGEL